MSNVGAWVLCGGAAPVPRPTVGTGFPRYDGAGRSPIGVGEDEEEWVAGYAGTTKARVGRLSVESGW